MYIYVGMCIYLLLYSMYNIDVYISFYTLFTFIFLNFINTNRKPMNNILFFLTTIFTFNILLASIFYKDNKTLYELINILHFW